jgi:hypothetical protein
MGGNGFHKALNAFIIFHTVEREKSLNVVRAFQTTATHTRTQSHGGKMFEFETPRLSFATLYLHSTHFIERGCC